MEIRNFLIAIAVQPIIIFFVWVVGSALIFICEEVNHDIKNFTRAVKKTWWDIEWRWKHR